MKIIESSFIEEFCPSEHLVYSKIEKAGRTCYKSEDKITDSSSEKFVRMIIARNHLSVLEHVSLSIRLIIDRGVSHEIVRHRLASFSQESTRYVNYGGKDMEFIRPAWFTENADLNDLSIDEQLWYDSMVEAEKNYKFLLNFGRSPQEARAILPNSLKTEIVITANIREWLHIIELRTSNKAHPDMKLIMDKVHNSFKELYPIIFDNQGE